MLSSNLLGGVKVAPQNPGTNVPEDAQAAWDACMKQDEGLVGAPHWEIISYIGEQPVKGINYHFFAYRTRPIANPKFEIFTVVINAFDGQYKEVSSELLY